MADPMEIAIRAEESAKSAHQRLNRMNGSLDRLTAEVARANAKSEEILIRLARDDGGQLVSRGVIDSRRFLITTIVLVLTSSVMSLLFTLALRSR
jgi:hypothetical protein